MHVISKKKLRDFWRRHPESRGVLAAWFKIMRTSSYTTWGELKQVFSAKVDRVGKKVVFDVGGNKYRIIAVIHFNRGKLYVREVLTHTDYDRETWK